MLGTSCLNIRTQYPTIGDGWYNISTRGVHTLVYCDMTAGGYTYAACTGCPSVTTATEVNGCAAKGLDMVIPRSKAHWRSLLRYVSTVLGAAPNTYFAVVPGIYKAIGGRHDCMGGMGVFNSAACATSGWRATDRGAWWVRDATYSEPSGDYVAN